MILTDFPPVPAALKNEYQNLIAAVDRLAAQLGSRLHQHIRCGPGCSSCCRRFSVVPIEAALIGERLNREPPAPNVKRSGDRCGFLIDDLCSIYVNRPLICRSQGLPIGYVDEMNEQIDVSVCPLNFSKDYQFVHEDLLFLDPSNRLLAELNIRYCTAAGIEPGARVSLG